MELYQLLGIGAAALAAGTLLENTAPLRVIADELEETAWMPKLPRMVQVSDLHRRQFGLHNSRLIRKIQSLHPELIVMTGDQISRDMTDFSELERLLWGLREIAPIVMSAGNHELDLSPELAERYREIMKRCGVHYLENRTEIINGTVFSGVTLTSAHYRNSNGSGIRKYHNLMNCTAEQLTAALGHCLPGTILLAHNPLFLEAYAQWGASLVLSGHVHGGVVRLPKLGGLLSPERRFFPAYDRGRYTLGQTTMIVSGGLGKMRFGNPPELRLITTGYSIT